MDRENQMRKIIIGDIHGCLEEVLTLLEEAKFDRPGTGPLRGAGIF